MNSVRPSTSSGTGSVSVVSLPVGFVPGLLHDDSSASDEASIAQVSINDRNLFIIGGFLLPDGKAVSGGRFITGILYRAFFPLFFNKPITERVKLSVRQPDRSKIPHSALFESCRLETVDLEQCRERFEQIVI